MSVPVLRGRFAPPARAALLGAIALLLLAGAAACGGGSAPRPTPIATKTVLAPIVDASIVQQDGPPSRTLVRVISALPNGCHHFAGARAERSGAAIRVTVENEVPVDPHVACTMIYGTHVEQVDVSVGLAAGTRYTVTVNGEKTLEFTAR